MAMDRITGIIPYNKCFYYNCFHSNLFPIIEANHGNCALFLANGIPYFQIQICERNKRLLTRFAFHSDYSKLLTQQGISVRRLTEKNKWKQVLDNALKNGKPVILGADGWYLDYRADFYHKMHWPHTLLIFGRNQSDDMYLVVDQPLREDMNFAEYQVTSRVLENAFEGFCKHKKYDSSFSSEEMLIFHFEQKPIPCTAEDVALFWRENRKAQQKNVLQGLHEIAEFEHHLLDYLIAPSRCTTAETFVLEGLNDIVKQKHWEMFFLEHLPLSYENCMKKTRELLSHWDTIRNLTGYIFLSGSPREKIVRRIREEYGIMLKVEREYAALAESEV